MYFPAARQSLRVILLTILFQLLCNDILHRLFTFHGCFLSGKPDSARVIVL